MEPNAKRPRPSCGSMTADVICLDDCSSPPVLSEECLEGGRRLGDKRPRLMTAEESVEGRGRQWYHDHQFNTGLMNFGFEALKIPCPAPDESAFCDDGSFHWEVQAMMDRIDRMGLSFTAREVIDDDILAVYYYTPKKIVLMNLEYQISFWCMDPTIRLKLAKSFLCSHLERRLHDLKHPLHLLDVECGLVHVQKYRHVEMPRRQEDVFELKQLDGRRVLVRKLLPGPKRAMVKAKTKTKPEGAAPLCRACGKVAKKLVVKKDGKNKGREFYGCTFACNFFKWA